MSTESSPFESDDGTITIDLDLPEFLRETLSKPFGPVVTEDELKRYIDDCDRVIAVGDIVTETLIRKNILPHVMIVDFQTRRGPFEEIRDTLRKVDAETITVANPPGKLTAELWNAVAKSIGSARRTKIIVSGEEDLASLAAIMLSDRGDCVIYGIPDEGIAVIRIDAEIRKKAKDILEQMISGR